jgi:hypothetical protein
VSSAASTADIVRQTIRHARQMSGEGVYEWRIARAALVRILADLEARTPYDPSLARLRAYVWLGDQESSRGGR